MSSVRQLLIFVLLNHVWVSKSSDTVPDFDDSKGYNTTKIAPGSTSSMTTTVPTTTLGLTTCNPNWRKFDNNCYRIYDEVRTWEDARSYCLRENSNLVSITTSAELAWLTSFVSEVHRESLWLGLKYANKTFKWTDKSPLSIVFWSPNLAAYQEWESKPCVYMESDIFKDPGYWSMSPCNEPRLFICKTKAYQVPSPDSYQTTLAPGCEKGMVAWRSSCYWFVDKYQSAYYATQNCMSKEGHLFDIEDLPELYFIKSLLSKREGQKIWTGLNQLKTKGIFQWSHGQSLHLNARQLGLILPTGYKVSSAGRCSYMKMVHGIHSMQLAECFGKYKTLCEKLRDGYTTHIPWGKTISVPTTPKPPDCPYKEFRMSGGKCIYHTFNKVWRSWRQAEERCKQYGGHLISLKGYHFSVSYNSYTTSREAWIGLRVLPSASDISKKDLRWTDGADVESIPIKIPQGKYEPYCAFVQLNVTVISAADVKFAPCAKHKDFICQVDKDKKYTVLPSSKIEKLPDCPTGGKGWYYFNGYCYFDSRHEKLPNQYLAWHKADRRCKQKGANLASVHSLEEFQFLMRMNKEYLYTSQFWIGLKYNESKRAFFWSDNTPMNIKLWRGRNFDQKVRTLCGANARTGYWIPEECYYSMPYVCKKPASVLPTTTARPLEVYKTCKKNWLAFGNKCFLKAPAKKWASARKHCKILNSTLASMHSEEELDFLALLYNSNAWIGLMYDKDKKQFKWDDGSEVTFTKWIAGQPDRYLKKHGEDFCVELGSTARRSVWMGASCSFPFTVLCQYYRELVTETTVAAPVECPQNMTGIGKNCYLFSTEKLTWNEAENVCLKQGGHLTSIYNSDEMKEITSKIIANSTWIGLSDFTDTTPWQWSSDWHVNFTNWDKNEPQTGHPEIRCAAMNIKGRWKSHACTEKMEYVCKLSDGSPPTLASTPERICPGKGSDGWLDLGGEKCYTIFIGDFKWGEGQSQCRQIGAELASFHSMEELKALSRFFSNFKKDIWIGLSVNATSGIYKWEDNSNVDFLYLKNEGSSSSSGKNCIEMDRSSLKWEHGYCYYSRNIICATNKTDLKDGLNENQKAASDDSNAHHYGSIIGFTILGICLTALVVVGIVYLRKRFYYSHIMSENTRGGEAERLTDK